ncbi:MAG: DUF998 domain-containing protein [Bacteroidia bacterium]
MNKKIAPVSSLILMGSIAFWIVFGMEFVLDFWFGVRFPGYDWLQQSISYLGQEGSPVEAEVRIWGFIFFGLFTLFAIALYLGFRPNKWAVAAAGMIFIYGLGEGIGSGYFPINPPGTPVTISSQLHNIFSGIGDAGLILFPFVIMRIYLKKDHLNFHRYIWIMIFMGVLLAALFLIAKYFQPDNIILYFKGLWQRLYLLNYYVFLFVISIKNLRNGRPSGSSDDSQTLL